MPRRIQVQPSRRDVGRRAAELVAADLADATGQRPALLLLSGGSSVLDVCAELARTPLPWHAIHVGQLDERVVPEPHPERSWPGIESTLLSRTPTEVAGRHPIPVDHLDGELAARSYDDTLGRLTRQVHTTTAVCGLGEDGHVASLLDGDTASAAGIRARTTGPYAGLLRVTVSMPFLRSLPGIVVVASGAAKATAMRQLVSSDAPLPAADLPPHAWFVVDPHAAAQLDQSPSQEHIRK